MDLDINGKPAAQATKQGADGSPPAWALATMIVIIGAVVLVFSIEEFSDGAIRSHVPFGNSDFFWVGLIFLPLVALVVLATASKLIEFRQAQSWSQTTAKIVRSEMQVKRHRFSGEQEKIENVPAVEYEFVVGGAKIRGRRIGIGDDAGGANSEATLSHYPLGANVTVYYDPADPTHCVLERGGPKGVTTGSLISTLAVLAVFAGTIYWLIAHGPAFIEARFPHAEAPVVVFAGAFGLAVLLFFIAAHRYSKKAADWPSVRGKIVSSQVEKFQKRVDRTLTTSYRPTVEYAYSVHGLDYRSNQIKVGMEVDGSQAYAAKVCARYPAGGEIDVHYDPANPSTSALENPTGATWVLALVAAACFALAVWQLGIFK